MIASRALAVVTLGTLLALCLPAGAQAPTTDRATAEALFREGKRLMGKRKFAEACPKLAESQRLDPQGGTLLNLAVCHAREGKTASAWAEFQEALALAREAKRNDRIRLATRELAELSPRLSHLVIEVPPDARVQGIEVRRDSSAVGEAAWGVAVPVDPGELTITARAPGYKPWSKTVVVKEAERATVSVSALEKLPPAPPTAKPKPAPAAPAEPGSDGSSQRLAAYVVGGVGVAALAVGGYFGLRAIDKENQSDDHCRDSLCDPEGIELSDEADTAATVSNVAFGIGIASVAAATYLLLTLPTGARSEQPSARRSLDARASVGAGSASILLSGAW